MASQSPETIKFVEEAKKVFDLVLSDKPSHFFALYGKALTLYKDNKAEDCLQLFDKAIKLKPDDIKIETEEMRSQILKRISLQPTRRVFYLDRETGREECIEIPKDRILCTICRKDFANQKSMKNHREVIHFALRRYKCSICLKDFSTKSFMRRHKAKHNSTKDFRCQICDSQKTFKVKKKCHHHQSYQIEDKPFDCDVCGERFKWKSYIQNHLKKHIEQQQTLLN